MFTYEYPEITGYRWNCLQKISITLGIPENEFGMSGNAGKCFLVFNRELTPTEKIILDGIMTNNPCDPPSTTGSVYKIVDIWESRQWFETQIGIRPQFWFDQGTPEGSGLHYMYVHLPRKLTIQEKKIILDVYRGMITEVL